MVKLLCVFGVTGRLPMPLGLLLLLLKNPLRGLAKIPDPTKPPDLNMKVLLLPCGGGVGVACSCTT